MKKILYALGVSLLFGAGSYANLVLVNDDFSSSTAVVDSRFNKGDIDTDTWRGNGDWSVSGEALTSTGTAGQSTHLINSVSSPDTSLTQVTLSFDYSVGEGSTLYFYSTLFTGEADDSMAARTTKTDGTFWANDFNTQWGAAPYKGFAGPEYNLNGGGINGATSTAVTSFVGGTSGTFSQTYDISEFGDGDFSIADVSHVLAVFTVNSGAAGDGAISIDNFNMTALTNSVVPYEGTVWELDMNTDPVLTNWTVRAEGQDNYTLTNGVMTMSSETLLDTEPFNTFKGLTQIDLQWRSITESENPYGAFLWANVDGDLPDKYSVIFQSHLVGDSQTVKVANGAVAEHTGFSTNMLTLSATLDAFNETADYIVTDGAYSVTNTISLAANLGAASHAITLGTTGPSAEVAYVRVAANVRPDEALLVASDEIAMELIDPATTVTGSVGLEYGTVSSSMEITAITVSDESHFNSFSVLTAAPQTLDDTAYGTTNLVVEFDNSVVGVVGTATGLVTVTWTETGTGVTNDTVVPVSAYYAGAAEPDVTWDAGGNGVNWGDAANWDTDEVPGTYADGSATIGNGGSATVATNFTGTYAYDVIVSNSSTLNIAADLQNVAAMSVGENGAVDVSGGELAAKTVTVANGAVLRLTDGSVTLGVGGGTYGATVKNGGVIEIEGGSFNLPNRIDLDAGGIFRVIGDEADVSLYQFSGNANGKVEFVLDETGVSPLVFSSWGTLAVGEGFAIDGSAYSNGPADILLYQSTSPVGLLDGKYTVDGLGDENVDWTITESTNSGHTVTLNILGLVDIGDITMGGVNEDGDIVFSWDTVDGQAYNVETNANLVYPNWGVSDGPIIGDGSPITVTNTPALDQLFYKVTSE